jgi:hypothetical protein
VSFEKKDFTEPRAGLSPIKNENLNPPNQRFKLKANNPYKKILISSG